METLDAGRQLIGHTLAVHIVIVSFSIGLPILMSLFEFWAWRRNDNYLRSFVRLLAKWAAVFVIGGIFTGTMVALLFSSLWAPFLDTARPHVGKFFQLEGYAFLIEAAFLSWYLTSLKHVGTRRHFLIGLPISLGTIGSAFFITVINAWMNNPSGLFTTTTLLEVSHSVTAYLFASTVAVLAYIAYRSLKKHPKKTHQALIWITGRLAIIGGVLILILGFLGHQSAVNIGSTQPRKLAGIELLDHTQKNAPIRVGGSIDAKGNTQGGIAIPGALSILAGGSTNHTVTGLDAYQRSDWPPLVVHTLFDAKMAIIGLVSLLLVITIGVYLKWKRFPRALLIALIPTGLLGFTLVELGWLITEFGRQPYTIANLQSTASAYTPGANIANSLPIFLVLFGILTASTVFALAYTTRHWRNTEKTAW